MLLSTLFSTVWVVVLSFFNVKKKKLLSALASRYYPKTQYQLKVWGH